MKFLVVACICAGMLLGQQGAPVQPVLFPYPRPTILAFDYVTGGATYYCYATPSGPWNSNAVPATFSWTRAASTLTSIVVSSNVGTGTTSTAHGLSVGNPVVVTGATVDTDLNATYAIATVPTSTTFTIATSMVADATYTESTLVVTTSAPRTTVAIWSIMRMVYDGSNNLVAILWANGAPGTYNNICSSRATLTYR